MPNQETFHLATSVFQTKHWRWPLCRWPWGAGWPYKVREGPKIRDLNLTVTRLRGRQKYCTTVSYYTLEPQDFVPYSVSSMHWSGSDFTTVHRRTRARLTCWPYKVDKHDTNLLSLPACSFALKLVTFGWFLFLRYLQTFIVGQREPFCCIALNASFTITCPVFSDVLTRRAFNYLSFQIFEFWQFKFNLHFPMSSVKRCSFEPCFSAFELPVTQVSAFWRMSHLVTTAQEIRQSRALEQRVEHLITPNYLLNSIICQIMFWTLPYIQYNVQHYITSNNVLNMMLHPITC